MQAPRKAYPRKLLIGATAVVLGCVLAAVLYFKGKDDEPQAFETVSVDRGDITAKVSATGTLSALVTVQVGSQVSGRIEKIFVDFNAPVKKGQPLAKIDPEFFVASLEQARANFLIAQGDLTKSRVQALDAKRQNQRTQTLSQQNLVAQADVDTAQTNADVATAQIEVAQGRLDQARAALRQAEVNVTYTNILSPIDGVVVSRNVDVGQTVAASLQAPVLFVIAETLTKMQVDTSVAEADVGKLKDGMKATFTVDAFPETHFTGQIRQIRHAPQTVQNVVTYNAVIDVANADLQLKPGMTANVTVVYAERLDVVRVPNAALRFKPSAAMLGETSKPADGPRAKPKDDAKSKTRVLWRLAAGELEKAEVEVGLTDGLFTEIIEGSLQAGQAVVTEGLDDSPKSSAPPRGGGMRRFF